MRPAGKHGLHTVAQLLEFYERFNRFYFGNTLPFHVEIRFVESMPAGGIDSVACALWRNWENGYKDSYQILFLRQFFAGKHPHLILCSLLHEMVHVYVSQIDPVQAEGHGPLFKQVCRRLQKLGWNVDVVLKARQAFTPRDRSRELSRPPGRGLLAGLELIGKALGLLRDRRLAGRGSHRTRI